MDKKCYKTQIPEWLSRTELLIGQEKVAKLQNAHVLVVGLGGVGAFAAEMLARAGVGTLTIVDSDVIKPSNRNRQILALKSTENKHKVKLMKERLLDINPEISINTVQQFLNRNNITDLLTERYDYVIDAIDTLSPKLFLIVNTIKNNYPLISSMGAGGKIDPFKVKIDDISKSYNCMLARMIRKKLNKFGIKRGFDVVFSTELVNKSAVIFVEDEPNKKTTVGTLSYMPAIFGIFAASKVIRELIKND
ncbi:MAG: tRNA threonylcarbamoyladenosine dehydratase [Marinilabiliaceae bacterium]|nr:tRNA threonylcarbamoyladenosine dehydratase [Marinilabiliaceae bacterium]